jgi:hypothetical protein
MSDPILLVSALGGITIESLAVKDFLLGFFMALALRRGRIETIISSIVPTNTDSE